MKILLIKPYSESNEIIPPLGLGYLASSVKGKHSVEIIDGILHRLNLRKLRRIVSKHAYDVIGIQCYSSDFFTVSDYINLLHQITPESILITGGPHPTAMPIQTLKMLKYCDFAFAGEAEIGFKKLIDVIAFHGGREGISKAELSSIPGLIYRYHDIEKGVQILMNPIERCEELDGLDPSYELLHLEQYPVAPHGAYFKQYPTAPVLITRGCPNQCEFCGGYLVCGTKIRKHSIQYVKNIIKKLYYDYGIREIHIEDDNFTSDPHYIEEFCNALLELKINITWTCANGVRLDTLSEPLLSLMKKSGMYSISIGIEAASGRIRKLMNKNLKTHIIFDKIKIIKKLEIDCIGFFILGYPTETEHEILQTIKLARSLPLIRANFSIFKPFPGTKIFQRLVSSCELKALNLNMLTLHVPVWADKNLGIKTLNSLKRKAILSFYLQPKIFFNIFMRIKNIFQFEMILLRIFRILFKNR